VIEKLKDRSCLLTPSDTNAAYPPYNREKLVTHLQCVNRKFPGYQYGKRTVKVRTNHSIRSEGNEFPNDCLPKPAILDRFLGMPSNADGPDGYQKNTANNYLLKCTERPISTGATSA
jgi:hypothetical protein